ncbi:DUF4365 domain-containing protein [Nonomuraea sp. NPDC048892]|uniref:DUF4365 domain-containing protein n=1 Tax=Nonomuraea sp. NPDC048892 TaxID=3154624 RepID=UPI0033E570BD
MHDGKVYRPPGHRVSRQGVTYCQRVFDDTFGWLFRELPEATDYGVDAQVEIVIDDTVGNLVTGKLLGLQIKSGRKTYFREPCDRGWLLRPKEKHVRYWSSYAMPVLLVIYDEIDQRGFWQLVNGICPALANAATGGWKVWVPETHDLEAPGSMLALRQIVGGGGHYTYELPDTSPWNTRRVSGVTVSFGPTEPLWRQPSFWEWQDYVELARPEVEPPNAE